MISMKPRPVLQMTMTLALLSALAACGGGGGDDSSYTPVPDPQTPTSPTSPTPPTQPTPPTGPTTPTNPPPTDPAPPDEIVVTLADTFTDFGATISTSVRTWPDWVGTGQPVDGVGCA